MIFSFGTIKNGELATFEPNDGEVIGRLMDLKKVSYSFTILDTENCLTVRQVIT